MYAASVGADTSNVKDLPLWVAKIAVFMKKLSKERLKILAEEFTVSDTKARAELGYKAAVTLEEGLKEMYVAPQ